MAKFVLASEYHGSLYVYNTSNTNNTSSTHLIPHELKFSEVKEKSSGGQYSEHWVLDKDHLLVEWDATGYEEGDETPSESKTFNATVFSLITYLPLATCTLGASNARIAYHEIITNVLGEKFLCLFVTDEWDPRYTIKLWKLGATIMEVVPVLLSPYPPTSPLVPLVPTKKGKLVSMESYEEWLTLDDEQKFVTKVEDFNLLVRDFFQGGAGGAGSLGDTFDVCRVIPPVNFWETSRLDPDSGRDVRDGWCFLCTQKRIKYTNDDIPNSGKYYSHIKHHLLPAIEKGDHKFALLVNDTSVADGEWNYQIISFPCDCNYDHHSPLSTKPTVLYKKDFRFPGTTMEMKIPGAINFLVLTEELMVVSTSENLFPTDLYLNIQHQIQQPLLPDFFLKYPHLVSRIKLDTLPLSTQDVQQQKQKLTLILVDTLPWSIPLVFNFRGGRLLDL